MFRNAMSRMTDTAIIKRRMLTYRDYIYVEAFAERNSTNVKIINSDSAWCDAANCILYDVELLVSEAMIRRLGIGAFDEQLEDYINAQTARDEDAKAEKEELRTLREKVKRLEAELAKKERD